MGLAWPASSGSAHVGDEVEAALSEGQRGAAVEITHEALGGLLVGVELGLVEALHDDARGWRRQHVVRQV